MTTKEKYELIDKTKVSAKVLEILEKMEKASSNFTNAEVNSRVYTALDKIIEGLKVSKPEALLSVSDAKINNKIRLIFENILSCRFKAFDSASE